ncbi:hypothetical protein [Cellulophaga sp. Asnod2-G02]|uniref:hypothetical protein n=1 Tax=Cellulophaga sp. Asnod2-G02 TaxID=3160572 RepID=UPI00386C588A
MKKLNFVTFLTLLVSSFILAQTDYENLDKQLGLRIKKNGNDYIIYADQNLNPNPKDYRKINYQVYFRKIDYPTRELNGINYQLITIPGNSKKQNQNQNKDKDTINTSELYPRAGKTVNEFDYDQNFWINVKNLENNTNPEYYKYANDVFSGLLTAPFKYRLENKDSSEAILDGDFNIAPFIGWKWRVSSEKKFYVAPFGFAGVTSLNYSSANNDNILDSNKTENGTGITYGMGISFKFGTVSPGFIIGWDKGFGDLGSGFKYNEKPWISFSVNYDFFKSNKTSEGKQ